MLGDPKYKIPMQSIAYPSLLSDTNGTAALHAKPYFHFDVLTELKQSQNNWQPRHCKAPTFKYFVSAEA